MSSAYEAWPPLRHSVQQSAQYREPAWPQVRLVAVKPFLVRGRVIAPEQVCVVDAPLAADLVARGRARRMVE